MPTTQTQNQPSPQTPVIRVIAYIDGFNLYFGMREKGWQRYYWLDVRRLVLNLLAPGQQLMAVRYFTSRVSSSPANPDQRKRQSTYLEAIGTLADTTIQYGHYLSKRVVCHSCGAAWTRNEEKMTDVNIAVTVISDAFSDRFDTALLISADSDLTGPILQVKQFFPAKHIVVAFPPARTSARLLQEAHASFTISRKKLKDSQFPDRVAKADGFVLQRPVQWR
jgi:NYN domain-containing protein